MHEISAGVLAQIRSVSTKNREMLRSQNRPGQMGDSITSFFLRIRPDFQRIFSSGMDTKKWFACSENRN